MTAFIDAIRGVLDLQALVMIIGVLIAVRALSRITRDPSNKVEAADFVGTRGTDGEVHGDTNKLAKTVFIFASTGMVGYTFWSQRIDNFYVVGVFAFWAICMLGIDAAAAWGRSFVDRRFGAAPMERPQGAIAQGGEAK